MTVLKKRCIIISVAAILVIAIVLSSFVYINSQKPSTGSTQSITLGVIPLELNSLIYVADNQNYFAANGLNVTFKSYDSGFAAMQGMLAGQVNIAFSAEFVVAEEALANMSFWTLGSIAKYNFYNIVARTDQGISSPQDLASKKVGVAFGSIAEFYLGSFLELSGLNQSSVTLVNVPNSQTENALENGTVDAVVTYPPVINQIESSLGNDTVVWSAQANQLGYWDAVCTPSWAQQNHNIIVHFLKSLIEAQNYLMSNQNQAMNIVTKTLNYSSTYLPSVWSDYQFSVSLDQAQVLAMQEEAQWLIANKLTDATSVPSFTNYIYASDLESVNPGSVNLFG
jgi:NitT/TauT family transport system substrate-binding protein